MNAVVHCSNTETFGYSMIEPLLLGIPTVVTKVGIGYEIENNNAAVVIPKDDIHALVKGIENILAFVDRKVYNIRKSQNFVF